MIHLLDEYIKELQPSRPIFKLRMSSYNDAINADLIKVTTPVVESDNVFKQLVHNNIRETLIVSEKMFKIDSVSIEQKCISEIVDTFKMFLETSNKFKNPRQSKLWKFIYRTNSMGDTGKIEGLLLVYRYLRENGMPENGRASYLSDSIHVKNALVILDAIREKYEQS